MAIVSWTLEEVKTGHIRPWYGLRADIPSGWHECDGTNGTPDLRGIYPKGAPVGIEANVIGGNLTHTHADHPVLTHSGGAVDAHSAHSVTQPAAHTSVATKQGTASGNVITTGTHSGTAVAAHPNHVFTQPGQHALQGHDSPNHEPPFKTTIWIMKL